IGAGIADTTPRWLPLYPGATIQWDASVHNQNGEHNASFHFTTADSSDAVATFYSSALKDAGLKVTTSTVQGGTGSGSFVTGSEDANKRSCFVMIAGDQGSGNKVSVTFGDKE
ncbi:MAG TPA: hypothetical protein VJX67_07645, partial [Blastocatellia bacterium]|nr:hypothetical protein [Blastocatellia bacterium]